jgi:hypothetical protein
MSALWTRIRFDFWCADLDFEDMERMETCVLINSLGFSIDPNRIVSERREGI